ncbi:MAG: NAD-dependent epimerase/dehydratase family protein [Thermoanaerobaculaceae bacterium]
MTAPVPGTTALVTGATGFAGSHVARVLAGHGVRVRALSRRPDTARRVVPPGVEVVAGDLADRQSLITAASGQELVIHTAGRVSDWGPRSAFRAANVEGVENLVAACRAAGVRRLVHLSSLTVLGLPRDGRVVDEGSPVATPARGDHYSASKLAGERLVQEAHGVGGLETTVVRPGAIWGPGDPNVLPRVLALLRRGAMPVIGRGDNVLGLSHVDNLARGVVLAAAAPSAAGRLYHLTDGEQITARQALEALAAALGVRPPRRSVPYAAIYALAALVEGTARLLGRSSPPPLTRYGVRFVACDCRYDVSMARQELGYRPAVSFAEGVRGLGLAAAGGVG